MWSSNKVAPKSIKVHWIINNFALLSFFHSSSESVNDAFRLDASRAGLRRLPHRAALPWKWCHHDRDGQLWTHWWQDLWRRPLPDGECAVLLARRLQDNVTEVTIDLFGSCTCVCWELESFIGGGNKIVFHRLIPAEFPAFPIEVLTPCVEHRCQHSCLMQNIITFLCIRVCTVHVYVQ